MPLGDGMHSLHHGQIEQPTMLPSPVAIDGRGGIVARTFAAQQQDYNAAMMGMGDFRQGPAFGNNGQVMATGLATRDGCLAPNERFTSKKSTHVGWNRLFSCLAKRCT